MSGAVDPVTLHNAARLLAEARELIDSDPAAAEAKAREAIALSPIDPAAQRLLGAVLRIIGKDFEANEAEIAAIDASAHDPLLIRAAQCLETNNLRVAESTLRSVLRQRPDEVAAIRMLGEVAARAGVARDAEALFRRALELAPGFEYARLHFARILHDQNRSGQALVELDRITGELKNHEDTKALRASVLARVGEYHEAIRLYHELLTSHPDHLESWTSLAFLLKTVGKPHEAINACRTALNVSPSCGEAWWMLADLKTYEFTDADVDALIHNIGNADVSVDDRLRLHFTLGKAFEDRGDFDASFDQYSRGNQLRAAQVQHRPSRMAQLVDRTISLFEPEFLHARAGFGDPAADPIFIVGLPRSGSTLVEQILASHSLIEGTAELTDIYVLAKSLDTEPRLGGDWLDYPQLLTELPAEKLRELGRLYLERTRIQRKMNRPLFIDKMPNNWVHVGFIQLILPNAKIIDARRHPLACGFSNFRQLYARGHDFSYDFEHFGLHYREYVRLLAHFDRVSPGRIHRVIHERLVQDPEREIRLLLDFIGVPFEDACLRFYATERPVRTASAEQVRQPIQPEALESWRAFEPRLGSLKKALGCVLEYWDEGPIEG